MDAQKERQVVKLEVVGYSREEAEKLLKKYSCDELYHCAISGKRIKE